MKKNKKGKSLHEVRSSVNAKPQNINKKTVKEPEKKTQTTHTATEKVKTNRDNRKKEAKNVNNINAVIEKLQTKLEVNAIAEKLQPKLEKGKKDPRRIKEQYTKALRRARRTRKKIAILSATAKKESTPKLYNVMVQYDPRMYEDIKNTLEKEKMSTKITTSTYFYVTNKNEKELEDIKKKFGSLKHTIMAKRRIYDENGNPVMEKHVHEDGKEYETVKTELVPTNKSLTVRIHASKAKEQEEVKKKTKKPTHNTAKHKTTVVGKHIALKQQHIVLAQWRKLQAKERAEKRMAKQTNKAKKNVTKQKEIISKAA